jgi:ankyrin repeat protein
MMSVFLTQELEKHIAEIDESELIYLFCSAGDEKRNTGVAVLRGLIHQIIEKRPQLVKHAQPFLETPEKQKSTLSSLETLWIIFSRLITDTALGTMFCVLDGLDECDGSSLRVLLQKVVNLLTLNNSLIAKTFKLVVVSREIHALRGCDCSRIRLDPDNDAKVDSDIELFVSTRVQELSRIEGFNNDFQLSVHESLLQRAGGTFLWVGFAMYELSQKQTCSEILEVLEDLPTGLPAIYDRMLLQIPARHRKVSQAILRWVTFAVRPLELEELAAAVGLQPHHPQLNIGQVARDAINQCGPLLKIQEKVVSLVHQSVRDHLLREEHESNAVLDAFRLQAEPSHLELAQKCLDCLAQSNLQYQEFYSFKPIDLLNSPLLRYAIFNWPEHAKNSSALAARLIDPHGFFLKKTSPLRIHWWNRYIVNNVRMPEPQQLLHIACSLEIIPWVEALLSKKKWMPRLRKRVNKKGRAGETALHYAARTEDIALVQLLLDRGANIKAKNNNGRTALHIAVENENTAVVQLLLDWGADVNAKDWLVETALHAAAEHGSEAIVQLLLDRGTNIETQTENEETALHYAVREGSTAIVQLLLDRGTDIDAKSRCGRTALHLAVEYGSEALVQLLLDRGADVEAKGENKYTALHYAAIEGNRAAVQLLLDRGTDIDAKNRYGRTALHCSAWQEREDVVCLLVDRGADVNAKDGDGNTALQKAMVGREEMSRLWKQGPDLEETDTKSAFYRFLREENKISGSVFRWTDPEKRKAISDFLRSRMEPSEI